jgi:hypothetical protein
LPSGQLFENHEHTRRQGALGQAGRAISADGALRAKKIYDSESGQYHYEGGAASNTGVTIIGLGEASQAPKQQQFYHGSGNDTGQNAPKSAAEWAQQAQQKQMQDEKAWTRPDFGTDLQGPFRGNDNANKPTRQYNAPPGGGKRLHSRACALARS